MDQNYKISELDPGALEQALDLVWKTFLVFEAPDYTDEGVQEFKKYIEPCAIAKKLADKELKIWTCRYGGEIVGVIAANGSICHINLLFVDSEHHRKGIARSLVESAINHYKEHTDFRELTVNSSPYAVPAYHRLGFVDTAAETTQNGLTFIPMEKNIG